MPECVARLRKALVGDGSFRGVALTVPRLLSIISDGDAPAWSRAAAGVALSAGDDDAREQLRLLSGGTVDERLRVALEAAADDDEAAMADALAAIDAERSA
jgi:hypothetical protein